MGRIHTFKEFHNNECNVDANELKPGDRVENINDQCKHFRSTGTVVKMLKIPQEDDKVAGNVCEYKVDNCSGDFKPGQVNGKFKQGDMLRKTEIQLRKL